MKKLLYSLFIVIAVAGVMASTVLAIPWVQPAIMVGQNTEAGRVNIVGDENFLTLTFMPFVNDGWCMTETHVHAAASLEEFPQNKGGAIPGQFDFKFEHDGCITHFTLQIPVDPEWYGEDIFIAIHTVFFNRITGEEETGWTVNCTDLWDNQFPGRNWSAYSEFPANAWQ